MKRLGAVVRFRPGTTKAKAEGILTALAQKGIIELDDWKGEVMNGGYTIRHTGIHTVHEYEQAHGEPVWYIP